jgi:hypothetical protein
VAVEAFGLRQALEAVPVGLSTMGRGLDADPEAFIASAIAGRWAASIRSCAVEKARGSGGWVQRTSTRSTTKIKRLATLDRATGTAIAVALGRRDDELASTADLHAMDALVPAGDDHADPEAEVERRATVPGGVELLAGECATPT